MELNNKLKVLLKIANVLNENHVVWAVGGSLLLYFKDKTDTFHDIDLMVSESDIEKLKELFNPIGISLTITPNNNFKTKHFLKYKIDDVEVDVMAGLIIVKDGIDYDCSLTPELIVEHFKLENEVIPLQSLSDWKRYYELMGRMSKVKLLKDIS